MESPGTRNAPLWLRVRLPRDVAVELTARSETASGSRPGDVKLESFGGGRDHGSGYLLVYGGWGDALSVIARQDEIGRTYRMRVERRGARLRWLVDGEEFLVLDDPQPLEGARHDHFGFSSWDVALFFDEFRVEPLGGEET